MDETLDETKAEAFSERMLDVLNCGSLALMTSIGHQLGLFDTMSSLSPSTSAEIAAAARLDERYVREWLGAMVTGKFAEYEPDTDLYSLPPEHASYLTRAAGPDNMAAITQYISLLATVEPKILDCFRNGGGVHYSEFEQFHRIMAEESGAIFDAGLVQSTLPLVPGLVERMRRGIDVLDLGCGSGHAVSLMAVEFPKSRFAGYDFSTEAIENGRAEASTLGLANVRFEAQDVAKLTDSEAYDLITAFDSIHDQAQPARVLEGAARALRPDGIFLMADIAASSRLHENLDHTLAPFLYTVSCMHCMTVSLALKGEGLGAMWGKQKACSMLDTAGFARVELKSAEGDPFNYYYIARKR